jgi:predicted nucleic acid-binding protein
MRFVDTNVLLYSVCAESADIGKASKAADLLTQNDLALSVQVLQEFYVQSTRPSRPKRLSHEEAAAFVSKWMRFPVQDLTVSVFKAALSTKARFQISYWDAAILEAARAAGCDQVLSEDLNHGQDYGGVRIINPFL